jgi:hypothetical protein
VNPETTNDNRFQRASGTAGRSEPQRPIPEAMAEFHPIRYTRR